MKPLQLKMQLKKPSMESACCSIDEFISYLFSVRTTIHLYHLVSKSYSEHVALNDLYNDVLAIVDSLAETAQTEYLLNLNVPASKIEDPSSVNYIKYCLTFVRDNRMAFPYTFQQNVLDNLEESLSKTIYKLTFLK